MERITDRQELRKFSVGHNVEYNAGHKVENNAEYSRSYNNFNVIFNCNGSETLVAVETSVDEHF